MLKTTREQLEKLKALEAQSTPGPWSCGDATGKTHWAGRESIIGVIGAAPDRQVAILCSANYNFRECIENMPVIAESRNALAALLHDANVAHRLHTPRRLDEWHEDFGPALWFHIPIQEPPYCGTPDSSDWPYAEEDEPALVWTPLPDANTINDAAEALLEPTK